MRNFETTEVFEFTCNKCGKEVDCSMAKKENKTVIYVRECPCVTEIIAEQEARIVELLKVNVEVAKLNADLQVKYGDAIDFINNLHIYIIVNVEKEEISKAIKEFLELKKAEPK